MIDKSAFCEIVTDNIVDGNASKCFGDVLKSPLNVRLIIEESKSEEISLKRFYEHLILLNYQYRQKEKKIK